MLNFLIKFSHCPSSLRSDYYYHREWRDVVKMIYSGAVDVSIADILMKPQDLDFAQFIAPLVNVRYNSSFQILSKPPFICNSHIVLS
jgi:hypothetical protein